MQEKSNEKTLEKVVSIEDGELDDFLAIVDAVMDGFMKLKFDRIPSVSTVISDVLSTRQVVISLNLVGTDMVLSAKFSENGGKTESYTVKDAVLSEVIGKIWKNFKGLS